MNGRTIPGRTSLVLLVAFGLIGCGSDEKHASSTPAQDKHAAKRDPPKLPSPQSLSRCIRAAGVTLNRNGATPDDPDRTRRPRGYNPSRADVTYLGAANFAKGGFADVWVTEKAATAKEVADSFSDPALNPSEAKDYSFDSNGNVLMAFRADLRLSTGDPSAKRFDRCL